MALEPHQQKTSGVNYPPPAEELAAEEVDSNLERTDALRGHR